MFFFILNPKHHKSIKKKSFKTSRIDFLQLTNLFQEMFQIHFWLKLPEVKKIFEDFL